MHRRHTNGVPYHRPPKDSITNASLYILYISILFSSQTLEVDKSVNCCTEIMVESFDQLETLGSRKDGLLYGVPVSIKENIACKVQ